jgi:hypothetical protein
MTAVPCDNADANTDDNRSGMTLSDENSENNNEMTNLPSRIVVIRCFFSALLSYNVKISNCVLSVLASVVI